MGNQSAECVDWEILTFPSLVTAANVVLLVGDHATSPTAAFKSNDIAGFEKRWSQSFTVQSALALMNTAFGEEKGQPGESTQSTRSLDLGNANKQHHAPFGACSFHFVVYTAMWCPL